MVTRESISITTCCHHHRHIVLDEADQMLDMGFADSVNEILAASFQNGKLDRLDKWFLTQTPCHVVIDRVLHNPRNRYLRFF